MPIVLLMILILFIIFFINAGLFIALIVKFFKNGRNHPSTKRFFLLTLIFFIITFAFCSGGFLWFWGQQVGGPAPFAVSSQAEKYLESLYEEPISNLKITYKSHVITSKSPLEGYYILEYRFSDNKGIIKASHSNYSSNKVFHFIEVKENDQIQKAN